MPWFNRKKPQESVVLIPCLDEGESMAAPKTRKLLPPNLPGKLKSFGDVYDFVMWFPPLVRIVPVLLLAFYLFIKFALPPQATSDVLLHYREDVAIYWSLREPRIWAGKIIQNRVEQKFQRDRWDGTNECNLLSQEGFEIQADQMLTYRLNSWSHDIFDFILFFRASTTNRESLSWFVRKNRKNERYEFRLDLMAPCGPKGEKGCWKLEAYDVRRSPDRNSKAEFQRESLDGENRVIRSIASESGKKMIQRPIDAKVASVLVVAKDCVFQVRVQPANADLSVEPITFYGGEPCRNHGTVGFSSRATIREFEVCAGPQNAVLCHKRVEDMKPPEPKSGGKR